MKRNYVKSISNLKEYELRIDDRKKIIGAANDNEVIYSDTSIDMMLNEITVDPLATFNQFNSFSIEKEMGLTDAQIATISKGGNLGLTSQQISTISRGGR